MMYWEYGPVHRRLSHSNDDMARIRATKIESEPRSAVIVDGLGPSASLLPPAGCAPGAFSEREKFMILSLRSGTDRLAWRMTVSC
jgi:hypothetical protein